ncbi:acyltransferase family protein [Pseudactinotalea sp. HY158]|nr:acyltransferase family protein [Pseudactinotalea sp. HY158]
MPDFEDWTGSHSHTVRTIVATASPPVSLRPHRLPAPAHPAAAPAQPAQSASSGRRRARDPFVDLVRALGTLAVVAVHWLMPQVAWDGTALTIGNALATGPGWLLTWVLQVLPLLFFAAGAAAGLGRRESVGITLRRRLPRLLTPVLAFALTWAGVALLLPAVGVPGAAVAQAVRIVPQPLWFLGVYGALLLLTPALRALVVRLGWAAPLVLLPLPVIVDLLRFSGAAPQLAWLNLLAVWAVPFTAGLAYALLPERRPGARAWWIVAALALSAALVLLAAGPYPLSLIGMPGEAISNLSPPTLLALAHAILLTAVALALRGPFVRLATGPLRRLVGWVSARSMTIYVWHLSAMFVVLGVGLLGLGLEVPPAWSAAWWWQWPLWCAAAAWVLRGLARIYHRFELMPARRPVPVVFAPPTSVMIVGPENRPR